MVPVRYLLKGLNISGKINTDAKLDSDKWLKSAHLPTKRFRWQWNTKHIKPLQNNIMKEDIPWPRTNK